VKAKDTKTIRVETGLISNSRTGLTNHRDPVF
jgi:hypothetical protein